MAALKSRWWRWLPVGALVVLLLAAFLITVDAERENRLINTRGFQLLLILIGLALLGLFVRVGAQLWLLWQRYRRGEAGARLETRLSLLFAALALPPAFLVAAFALRFIDTSIDSWFRADVEAAQQAALTLGQLSLEREADALDRESRAFSSELSLLDADGMQDYLDALVDADGARAMHASVYDLDGNLEALSFNTSALGTVNAPAPHELVELDPAERRMETTRRDDVRVARLIERFTDDIGNEHVMQVLLPLDSELAEALATLERNVVDYRQLRFQRDALKTGFSLILGLITLIAAFAALWFALLSAGRVVAPVVRLTAATREIAAGRQSLVPVTGRDEIAFLSASFNRMSGDLAEAKARQEQGRQQIERERQLLEAVLERLSAGVMAIEQGQIVIANQAAQSLLAGHAQEFRGLTLSDASLQESAAARFFARVQARDLDRTFEWREEIEIGGEAPRTLLIRALRLAAESGERLVLVFDDANVLAQASREAAWAEVARRLAHEIKNPLTPIQLAAERVKHRLSGKLAEPDREVVDRATQTIVQQVEALKRMVNDFGQYARPSRVSRERFAPVDLLDQVARLYEASAQCRIERDFKAADVQIDGDRDRLRQVFVNLLTNAIEAGAELAPLRISLTSRREGDSLLVAVRDFGPGLPADFAQYAFEPYRSTKPKGSGLGLSLVKKVMEEHGGTVQAGNAEGGGARFLLRFVLVAP
ncbi:MAG: HAMP domain-containing protein [Ahniella sp.]|nr:HAMP domain-containing protein [Ahniella sp.]